MLWGYVTALRAHARREWMKGVWGGWCGRGGHRGVGWVPAAASERPETSPPGPFSASLRVLVVGGLSLRGPVRVGHTQRDQTGLTRVETAAAQGPRRGPCRLTARSCSGFQGPWPPVSKVQTAVVAVGRPLRWCSLLQPATRVQTDAGSVATMNGSPAMARGGLASLGWEWTWEWAWAR